MDYLRNELLARWKTRIIKCFTNKILSFDNTTTSRAEEDHAKLKRSLKTSIEDLRKIVNVIELLLKNERSEYMIAQGEAIACVPQSCNIQPLKNLKIHISPHALRLIRKQLDKFIRAKDPSTPLPSCTKTYELSMGLPCAHLIERREMRD